MDQKSPNFKIFLTKYHNFDKENKSFSPAKAPIKTNLGLGSSPALYNSGPPKFDGSGRVSSMMWGVKVFSPKLSAFKPFGLLLTSTFSVVEVVDIVVVVDTVVVVDVVVVVVGSTVVTSSVKESVK